jgi:hypothetical protein
MDAVPAGPSLLWAILAPAHDLSGVDAMDHAPADDLEGDVKRWARGNPAKRALMVQALYQALPYAFSNEDAARYVGRLLARAVEGMQGPMPEDPEGLAALRREIREQLQAQFDKFKEQIP